MLWGVPVFTNIINNSFRSNVSKSCIKFIPLIIEALLIIGQFSS